MGTDEPKWEVVENRCPVIDTNIYDCPEHGR